MELRFPADARAPGAARMALAATLHERVAARVIEAAELLVTELVANSVRHSGASGDEAIVVRAALDYEAVRVEVEDPGQDGLITPHPPDLRRGGGFGLNLVEALSASWGVERAAGSGTRVWAELPLA